MTTIESPQSFKDFIEENPDLSQAEALQIYDERLTRYRKNLAESTGVSETDLHLGVASRLVDLTVGIEGVAQA